MKKKSIHFVGIKGVGMTPLAIIAKEAGLKVTGSDVETEFITDKALAKAGIKPLVGFSADHIEKPDLVITSGANSGFDNVEVKKAKEQSIEIISTGQAVGLFMQGKLFNKPTIGISIAGTHGKTTTTAMIATILRENKLDPSYVIGTGDIGSLGLPGHFGRGKYFIAEADEYATEPQYDQTPKFLWQQPKIAIFTNIEFDHPDVFADIDAVAQAFRSFAKQLPPNGTLIACGDDRQIKKLLEGFDKKVVTYGFLPENNYVITKVSISGDRMFFRVSAYGRDIGEFMLNVIGEHNALNALASFIAALEVGISLDKAIAGLRAFTGSKRRLEYIGQLTSGAKVYDDYAHHPTEIKATLFALRQQYPKYKIACLFQPHTYSRTKRLFTDFLKAFEYCDSVVITDIYASARETKDPSISSHSFVSELMKVHKNVVYKSGIEDLVQFVNNEHFRTDSVLVTMGAGDIYKIHTELKFV